MKKQKIRVWLPTSARYGSVNRWIWTRSAGLRVVYYDGLTLKSDWRTLPEFLKAVKERREHARELTPEEIATLPPAPVHRPVEPLV